RGEIVKHRLDLQRTVEWQMGMVNDGDDDGPEGARLDVWLDIACLFRTRSEAQKAARSGKIAVNGQTAKPNRRLRVADDVEISGTVGRHNLARVVGVADG